MRAKIGASVKAWVVPGRRISCVAAVACGDTTLTTDTAAQNSAVLKNGVQCLTGSRYGDYQAAAIDPADGTKVWVFGEYAADTSVSADFDWGTWIGQVQFSGTSPTPPPAPTANAATGVTSNGIAKKFPFLPTPHDGRTPLRVDRDEREDERDD